MCHIYRRATSSSGKALSWADIAASPSQQITGKGSGRSKSATMATNSDNHQPTCLRQNQSDGTHAVLAQLPGTRCHVSSSSLDQELPVGIKSAIGNRTSTSAVGTGSTLRPAEVPRQLASSVNNVLDAATRVTAEGRGPSASYVGDISTPLWSCGRRDQLVAER